MAWIESHQTLKDHPKLTDLSHKLQISRAQTIGHLQMLWWWCISYADDGVISRYTPHQIAAACDWNANAGEFIQALADSGFIDRDPLRIHDWLDFCGDLIKKRLEYKSAKRRRTKRLGKSLRKTENSQLTVTNRNQTVTRPNQPTNPEQPPLFDFEDLWKKYPKRLGKEASERHFRATVKSPPDHAAITAALNNYLRYIREQKIEAKYIKHGSSWFNTWREWTEYTGDKHASNGCEGVSEYAAIAKRARQSLGLREPPTAGEILAGVRVMPEIPHQNKTAHGNGYRDDGKLVEALRATGVEAQSTGP